MSELMSSKINELHQKYKFERMYILAHSMGGHVARYALTHESVYKSYVKLFVSISTPFGGEELAKKGVEKSPAVIPSWKDMVPNSEFIKHSFSRNMPSEIKYYLFFGHKGNRNPLRPNNDSTVTIESMLDTRAQSEAIKVFGFNEDHISILNSPDVLVRYKAILAGVEKEYAAIERTEQKGKIRLRYRLEETSDVPPLWMTMMFIPADVSRAKFTWSPDPLKTDQEIGPINSGVYEVGLSAWGYKVNPASVKVDVGSGSIPELTLSLKPQGIVGGQIISKLNKDDKYWGFLPSLGIEKKVTTISLTGNGMVRKIISRPVNIDDAMRDAVNGKDYIWDDFFMFFDIPKGQYELKVEARGCEPFTQTVAVNPKMIHAPLKISLCK
ncbi:MAG: alpha/beta hydrolase [Smithella sp.]